MNLFIGVDLGGTNIKAGLVDIDSGSVLFSQSTPTFAREGHDAVMARMADVILAAIAASGYEKSQVKGVGITAPGVLDLEKGLTLFLPNLPGTWPNVPLRATITAKTGLPTFLLNDARAITYGEWQFGGGRGAETMACFTLGTGVGGGLVINGKLHLGIGGTAGELGHQTIDFNGPMCGCGNRGCLEAYASGPAIAAMGVKAVLQGRTSIIGQLVNYDLNKITPEVLAEAAKQGDSEAKNIFELTGMYLGIAIGNVLVSVTPTKVVLAGGVAAAGGLLLDPIRRTLKSRVSLVDVSKVEIVTASLGNNAGVLGVASWAHQNLKV
ncbi:MAG: ROK family protein [Chloroflexi bacterium]|nr:MAG: ROK family protein [Chloroflexota bacterium]